MNTLLDRLRRTGSVLLEGDWHSGAPTLLFQDPIRIFQAVTVAEVPAVLDAVDTATRAGRYVAGFFAYEAAGAWCGKHRVHRSDQRLAWFAEYDKPMPLPAPELPFRDAWSTTELLDRWRFNAQVERIRELIAAGDVYQVNLTGSVRGTCSDAVDLYCALRTHRAPFRGWLNLGDTQLVSASPELFFRREGGHVETRPMKGTAAREPEAIEDLAAAETLAQSEKDRAENLMIVDLLRNDLGRVARVGSVEVPRLFDIETHRTVHQMTSTITASLDPDVHWRTLFEALFPCGSITGAPKLRAMERIRELEPDPRGVYCGTIGFAGPEQQGCFNVAIRTCTVDSKGQARAGVGAGIVWDSEPAREFEECGTKTLFLKPAPTVAIFETMRSEYGAIRLLDRHLERLARSAAYFGIPVNRREWVAQVEAVAGERSVVLRLVLEESGEIRVTSRPVPPTAQSWRIGVTAVTADRGDFRFYHKTTDRHAYNEAERLANDAGFDEGLLVNDLGEITEGSRTTVWIEHEGKLVTPPISAGVLPGVHRAHLLHSDPRATEGVITVDALLAAERVYCGNAVRGLIPVREVRVLK